MATRSKETLFEKLLEEKRAEHYSGPDPPTHISGEPKLKANGWFRFSWTSTSFGVKSAQMYLNYCLKNNRLYLLRIHPDWKAGKRP